MYPVSFEADYAAEGRNRLTTFFRYIVAIPWLIVAYLYGIGASIVVTLAWFAMVFTGRYPQQLYDFNVGYLRMIFNPAAAPVAIHEIADVRQLAKEEATEAGVVAVENDETERKAGT